MTSILRLSYASLLPIVAVFAPVVFFPDSRAQWEFALVVLASMLLLSWFGHLVVHAIAPDQNYAKEFFFAKICIGQFGALLLWLLLTPLLYGLQKFIKWEGALASSLLLAALLFAVLCPGARSSFLPSAQDVGWGRLGFSFVIGLCIFKIAAYHSVRAGALGLDTHQHIFYTSDLLRAGYLKLSAGATAWVERYPKGLHTVAAIWGAPALGDHLGPTVKIMPGLQLLLAVAAVTEIMGHWLRQRAVPSAAASLWWAGVALLVLYMVARGARIAYPLDDLNSTARLSAPVVIALTLIVSGLAIQAGTKQALRLFGFSLAFGAACTLKFHPALIVAFMTVAVPAWLAAAGYVLVRGGATTAKPVAQGLFAGGGGALLLLVTDPFYADVLLGTFPAAAEVFTSLTGLMLLPRDGALSVSGTSGGVLPMLYGVLERSLSSEVSLTTATITDSPLILSNRLVTLARMFVWTVLIMWAVVTAARSARPNGNGEGWLLPAVLMLPLLVGAAANDVVGAALAQTIGSDTIEASVLATYAANYGDLLALFVLPTALILSSAMLMPFVPSWGLFGARYWEGVVALGLMVAAVAGAQLRNLGLPAAPPAESLGWWHPVKERQLDEFQDLEDRLPKDAVVLVDATAAKLNERESWILPVGSTAAYLPLAQKEYIFNVRLGRGYALQYDDLYASFCAGDAQLARQFMAQHKVTHLLATDDRSMSSQEFGKRTLCQVKYSDLGVRRPAVLRTRDGVAFFVLDY
jgi:hypothetical protein